VRRLSGEHCPTSGNRSRNFPNVLRLPFLVLTSRQNTSDRGILLSCCRLEKGSTVVHLSSETYYLSSRPGQQQQQRFEPKSGPLHPPCLWASLFIPLPSWLLTTPKSQDYMLNKRNGCFRWKKDFSLKGRRIENSAELTWTGGCLGDHHRWWRAQPFARWCPRYNGAGRVGPRSRQAPPVLCRSRYRRWPSGPA
jgi:hypothetical protein